MFSNSHTPADNSSHHTRPTIGLLIVGVFPPNEELLWSGVEDAARDYDVNLISFCGSFVNHPDPLVAQANRLYQLVNPRVVDGLLIVSTVGWYLTDKQLPNFFECYHPLPCVSLDRLAPGVPSVVKNNYQGMYDALVHVIEEHGYRRIAFLQGIAGAEWEQERYRAYRDALNEYALPFDPGLVAPLPTRWDSSGVPQGGEEQIRILLEERKLRPKTDIEAIVGATDDLARQALVALRARKIAVPQEIAMIGFDDEEASRVVSPPLTTVRNPMYEIGRKGVEMLMAQLRGEAVPEQVTVSAPLIVRQSCGCRSSLVSRAVAGTAATSIDLTKNEFAARRDRICAELARTLDVSSPESNWPEILLEAFTGEFTGHTPNLFLSKLETLLNQAIEAGRSAIAWQNAISTLRCQILPSLNPAERGRAEDLWGQARVLIGEVAQRVQAHQTVQAKHQAQVLREIGAKLITTFDVEQLITILAKELPGLGITSCYLALYDADSEADRPHAAPSPCLESAPEWSRLILAYNERGRMALEPGGRRFRSCELAPADLLPRNRRYSLVMEPLYFQEQQIGFALFETGPREGRVYEALRVEISSALQGDLLVQRVQERTMEITRQKYVLDTFMETVPDSIYFKDRESRISRANQAHAEQLGLKDPGEEIGKTDFDFLPEHAARVIYEQEQAIMHSGQPIVSVEETDAQGRWRLTTKMPLRDERGNIVGTFGISRDITSLKHTEQELIQYREHLKDLVKERTTELTRSNERLSEEILERVRVEGVLRSSEKQYRLLAENVKDGILILQQGQCMFANKAFSAMTGYEPDELLSRDPMHLFHEHTAALAAKQFASEREELSKAQWQAELNTRDQRVIWTEIEQIEIVWNSESALLLTIRDITDRKLREQRLEEERSRLEEENLNLKSSIKERYRFGVLVGKSPAMQRVYELIVSAASSDVNVLISGESGTGKELIARMLHQVSRRKEHAFVPVNCASIPESLFEREFFGHRKGAFTGADRDTPGLFDKAHRGTLFLDEVTELPLAMQAKLLRVLQDGEYTPLGSTTSQQADVMLVTATNKDYQEEIDAKRLRKDFFYRIGVIEIRVPPLRERKDDLPLLIEHILEEYHRKHNQFQGDLSSEAPVSQSMLPVELMQALYVYDWPGNVRELQNLLQRYLATRDLSSILSLLGSSGRAPSMPEPVSGQDGLLLREAVHAFEKQMIADTLERHRYHIGKTAETLGLPRITLHRKIKKYQLK